MIENIRQSIETDLFYEFVYVNDTDGYFVQVGIEAKEQVDLLKQTNCKVVQGYYYHKPSSSKIITRLLSKLSI